MSRVVWAPKPAMDAVAIDPPPAAPMPRASQNSERSGERPGARAQRPVRIIMAGGGTGGHLYPGLAVAAALQEHLGASLELIWAATPRAVDQRLLGSFGGRYVAQPVRPLVRKVTALWPFYKGWQQSVRYWDERFSREGVDLVLALGGYAAGPAAHIAAKRGIPVALLNPDAVPGLANRMLLKQAAVIFSQWELPARWASQVTGRIRPVGCPMRADLTTTSRAEGAQRLGLQPERPTLLVTGGSLAARTINEAIIQLLADPELRRALAGWQVLHLAGTDFAARVRKAAEPITDVDYRVLDYCDDMAAAYAASDLAVARAGAGTCAELMACGVPAVLLPYPYDRGVHQRHNADQLVAAGCAVRVDDRKDGPANAAALKGVLLELLGDSPRRRSMAEQARSHGKPDAAAGVADELVRMLEKT